MKSLIKAAALCFGLATTTTAYAQEPETSTGGAPYLAPENPIVTIPEETNAGDIIIEERLKDLDVLALEKVLCNPLEDISICVEAALNRAEITGQPVVAFDFVKSKSGMPSEMHVVFPDSLAIKLEVTMELEPVPAKPVPAAPSLGPKP